MDRVLQGRQRRWPRCVKKDVAAEVWDATGQFTAGKAWMMAG
jgi:hypothetical protein